MRMQRSTVLNRADHDCTLAYDEVVSHLKELLVHIVPLVTKVSNITEASPAMLPGLPFHLAIMSASSH